MFITSKAVVAARSITAVAGFAMLLAACGGEESARDAAVDRAVADGLSQEVAECIVDAVEEAFGEEALAADYEQTPEQLDTAFEIADVCLFGD